MFKTGSQAEPSETNSSFHCSQTRGNHKATNTTQEEEGVPVLMGANTERRGHNGCELIYQTPRQKDNNDNHSRHGLQSISKHTTVLSSNKLRDAELTDPVLVPSDLL